MPKRCPHNCPRHHVALVRRRNQHGGGFFWGCSEFAETGCKVYWNEREGLRNPHVEVARASSRRSSVKSLKQQTIDELALLTGMPTDEIVSWIDRDGITVVRSYLAAV